MLKVTLDIENEGIDIGKAGDEYAQKIVQEISLGSQKELQKKANRIWPQRTGDSRKGFIVEPDKIKGADILVTNREGYAKHVNNRSHYKSGKPNPNYRAAQRTIAQFWSKITRVAGRRAAEETVEI